MIDNAILPVWNNGTLTETWGLSETWRTQKCPQNRPPKARNPTTLKQFECSNKFTCFPYLWDNNSQKREQKTCGPNIPYEIIPSTTFFPRHQSAITIDGILTNKVAWWGGRGRTCWVLSGGESYNLCTSTYQINLPKFLPEMYLCSLWIKILVCQNCVELAKSFACSMFTYTNKFEVPPFLTLFKKELSNPMLI